MAIKYKGTGNPKDKIDLLLDYILEQKDIIYNLDIRQSIYNDKVEYITITIKGDNENECNNY